MKVRIEFDVDIDPEKYVREYGLHPADVMVSDLRARVMNTVVSRLASRGVLQ